MSGVFSEILGPINHESFASKEVDSEWDALVVDFLLRALPEVLALLEAV